METNTPRVNSMLFGGGQEQPAQEPLVQARAKTYSKLIGRKPAEGKLKRIVKDGRELIRTTVEIEAETYLKFKTLSQARSMSMASLFTQAMSAMMKKYEEENGPVEPYEEKDQTSDVVF